MNLLQCTPSFAIQKCCHAEFLIDFSWYQIRDYTKSDWSMYCDWLVLRTIAEISFTMGTHCQIKTIPREPIPNYIDSITKKLKYVDPGHRQCCPGFKAASFTPANPFDKYNDRTHNCIATVTTYNGDRYSVLLSCHAVTMSTFSYNSWFCFVSLTTS